MLDNINNLFKQKGNCTRYFEKFSDTNSKKVLLLKLKKTTLLIFERLFFKDLPPNY